MERVTALGFWRPAGFAGFRWSGARLDLMAGLTLAAIAVPEQIATARLAGLPAWTGLLAFVAATLAFVALGSSRRLSAGADSTITPIFAGALALTAANGSSHFVALSAALALLTGAIVLVAGLFRMGWIGNLLSVPVTTGFLAGVAVHIVASQAPAALGLADTDGALVERLAALAASAPRANPSCLALAAGSLALIAGAHRLSPRLPGPLAAVAVATSLSMAFHLERQGVAVLGTIAPVRVTLAWPSLALSDLTTLAPLALLIALVVMVQTAATTRAFAEAGDRMNIDGDFVGVGAGNLLAGLLGTFPVNASPPRTAVVVESGGSSALAGLTAAGLVGAVLAWATGALAHVPQAALAGVLLFVAIRLVRPRDIVDIARASPLEGLLILVTAVAIVVLPIAEGVAVGVGLSLLNGLWSTVRVHVRTMSRLPDSTVWWPDRADAPAAGGARDGVLVLAFPAPLTFLNADGFAREFLARVKTEQGAAKLAVLEAAGLVEIDYTGARALRTVVEDCRSAGLIFAVARLESLSAQAAFERLGLKRLVGEDHIFESVAEAVAALSPHLAGEPPKA
jgi:MFS superfamily sulfate permease-like transporter